MTIVKFTDTPIGRIRISECDGSITDISFSQELPPDSQEGISSLLEKADRQLAEYFRSERTAFDLPLQTVGTPFQQAVWSALQEIPYGQTRTYKQIAERIGCPKACRAVGMANNRNPIAIVIPCHRVIGADGKLVGYAGGLNIKQTLLDTEQKNR